MEAEIALDVPLDYVSFQILPENRYEANICSDEKEEIMGHGSLDQLLEHLPNVKDQLAEGSRSCRLDSPGNVNREAWFTKATLQRFLHIVGSPDSLKKSVAISNEMSQLEETRKFHLSLYQKAGDGIMSSDNSKNELLLAVDSRLAALTEELVSTFSLEAGTSLSSQELINLRKFCQHFGDVNIRNLLSNLPETSQKSQTVVLQDSKESSGPVMSKHDYVKKTGEKVQISGSSDSVQAVKYNASPAKAAELERQSSTESDDSSFSSEDDQPPLERSRPLIRSASPRRSASPMRRIQVGRSGPRRTPALTIKSLTHFPARERIPSYRDTSNDDRLEGSEEPNKKTEVNVTRMSVQDAISLFESKQRDQVVDAQKKKSVTDNATNANKSVLRRWSSGMGESQKALSQNISEHQASEDSLNLGDEDGVKSTEVRQQTDVAFGNPESEEKVEVGTESETSENSASNPNEDDVQESQVERTSEKLDSAEWSRQKEAELSQMLMKFAQFNQSNHKISEPNNNNRNSSLEQRSVSGLHKERRDEKLKGENAGKKVEKQTEIRAKQKIVDRPKTEKSSPKVSDVGKKQTTSRIPSLTKTTPVSSNSKKEAPRPAVAKKAPSKSSSLPATRKSWPSTPSPRVTGTLPTKSLTGPPSATTAPRQKSQSLALQKSQSPALHQKSQSPALHQKPQSPASLSRPSPKLERLQQQPKEVKKPQVDAKKSFKKIDESKNLVVPKNGKTTKPKTKTKTAGVPEDASATSPAKAIVRKKVTKKSSVVPLEAKPSTRKAPGTSPAKKPTVQTTEVPVPAQADETVSKCDNPINIQENAGAIISDTVDQVKGSPVLEAENGHLEQEKELETEKPENGCEEKASDDGPVEVAERMESPVEIQPESEPVISPTAWVENNHQDPSIPSGKSSAPSPTNHDVVAPSEPRVRHSLSQMLLEESSEPDIIEWGNAEIPPTMVYQKDAPKGLKRLLKFARKNKGEANGAAWASPYTSDGEDDGDEYRSLGKRNSDNLLRKVALHSKNYGEVFLSDSEPLSARSNASNSSARSSNKLQESHASKGSRSFFSLSAFRGSKS